MGSGSKDVSKVDMEERILREMSKIRQCNVRLMRKKIRH